MSRRAVTGLSSGVLSGGPVGFEAKQRKAPLPSLPFGNYMWIQRIAHTTVTLHCYHVSNVSLLVLEVLRCQEQDNGGKPQDQICFPAPTSVARPHPVRCNHNPDSSNHAGGSCGKKSNTKKEEKVCSWLSTMKKRQNNWPRLVVHRTKNDSDSRSSW